MKRILALLLLTVASIFTAVGAFAQTPSAESPAPADPHSGLLGSRPTDAETKIRVNSNLVVLPVTVKDQFGELVPDLQQTDFRVFDGQIEQSLDVFTIEAFPLSLVVLIDDDLKSKDAAQMTPSLRAILGGISEHDEAMICRFDLSFYPGDSFSTDFDKLWSDLKRAQDFAAPSKAATPPPVSSPSDHAPGVGEPTVAAPLNAGHRPTKALDDAVHSAAELLHDRGAARRKMILIVSDGENGPQFNHHTYKDAVEALLRDNISVYSLAVGGGLSKHKFARLINYADDSGGDIYYASTSAAMERLYSQITEQARHEYTLAYVPRGTDRNAPYHKVEVRVARPGVTVKTRQGYYAIPASQPTMPSSATPSSGAPSGTSDR
jgi:Ca-activated chloride channel family protein